MSSHVKEKEIYICKKGILKNIVKDQNSLNRIKYAVLKINYIMTCTYQFIKLFCLFELKNNSSLPNIDINFIDKCVKTISIGDKRGRPTSSKNTQLVDKLDIFYEQEFKNLYKNDLTNTTKLNQILNFSKVQIVTAFENNIKAHFIKHLFYYINSYFDMLCELEYSELSTKKDVVAFRKDLRYELRFVKNDILNGTLTSSSCYHRRIKENRSKLVPKEYIKSIPYDLQANPLKYLPFMIHLNNELEKLQKKIFHCFPLRTDVVPKSIIIDTSALLELLVDKGTRELRNGKGQIKKTKCLLWNKYFKTDNNLMKIGSDKDRKYLFSGSIITDGIAVSVRFVRKDMYNKKVYMKNKINIDTNEFKYIDEITPKELNNLKEKYVFVYTD